MYHFKNFCILTDPWIISSLNHMVYNPEQRKKYKKLFQCKILLHKSYNEDHFTFRIKKLIKISLYGHIKFSKYNNFRRNDVLYETSKN